MYNTICWPVSHTWVFGVVYLKLNMRFPLEEFWNFQSESGMHLLVLFGLESRMYLLVLFQLESGKYVFVLLQRVAIGVRNVSLRLFSIKVWNWTLNVHVSLLTTTKCFLGDWYECWLRYLHILDHYLQVYMLLSSACVEHQSLDLCSWHMWIDLLKYLSEIFVDYNKSTQSIAPMLIHMVWVSNELNFICRVSSWRYLERSPHGDATLQALKDLIDFEPLGWWTHVHVELWRLHKVHGGSSLVKTG